MPILKRTSTRIRLLLAAGLALCFGHSVIAQSSLAPGSAHYAIQQAGKTLGDAQYSITTIPGGYTLTSSGHMSLAKFSYSFRNQGTLDAALNLVRDTLTGSVDGAKAHGKNISVATSTDATGREFTVNISADGKQTANTIDRHRNTVLTPDLDPGAYMLMARLALTRPQSAWGLIPKENGLLVPAGFHEQADVQGDWNNTTLNVKHITVALSDQNAVTIELYSAPDGQLLEADLNAQNLQVVRDGFRLLERPAPTPPPPGQAPQQQPGSQSAPQAGPAQQLLGSNEAR